MSRCVLWEQGEYGHSGPLLFFGYPRWLPGVPDRLGGASPPELCVPFLLGGTRHQAVTAEVQMVAFEAMAFTR